MTDLRNISSIGVETKTAPQPQTAESKSRSIRNPSLKKQKQEALQAEPEADECTRLVLDHFDYVGLFVPLAEITRRIKRLRSAREARAKAERALAWARAA